MDYFLMTEFDIGPLKLEVLFTEAFVFMHSVVEEVATDANKLVS